MRAAKRASAAVLTLVMSGLVVAGTTAGGAAADDGPVPSRQDVRDARDAADAAADDVASVRARLVLANQRLQDSAVQAARAAEEYNGARWRAQQARAAVREAERRADVADADVERQQEVYGDAVVTSYQMAPGLTALSALADSDGISTLIDRTATVHNAEDALDERYDAFRASATLAEVARTQAEDARAAAAQAEAQARQARDAARAAEQSAAAEAQSVADEKQQLITRLAELQHVSVQLAERRQSALEQRAAEAAQEAAQQAAQQAAEQAAQDAAQEDAGTRDHHSEPSTPAPSTPSTPQPSTPQPSTPQPSTPQPSTPQPPAPAGGASAAVAFARAQLGEPYRWAATGPDAWDCSGLTMGAWRAGGRTLPHYSVAQYEQSTPIAPSALRAGDLVFWGSSSDPSSIYHVAIYAGNGRIIHAPRTGRPVTEESMYYWITPNFYARP